MTRKPHESDSEEGNRTKFFRAILRHSTEVFVEKTDTTGLNILLLLEGHKTTHEDCTTKTSELSAKEAAEQRW